MLNPSFLRPTFIGLAALLTMALSGATYAEPSAPSKGDPGQLARGVKAWANNCASCHNLRPPSDLRDDQWRVVVAHMRVRADLTGQEARDVLRFLQESN